MPLPDAWVDRIFDKLALTYGRAFLNRWQGMDMAAVKSDWAYELRGFSDQPKAIAYALQNLPADKPPTVLEFRTVARAMPVEAPIVLDAPAARPEIVAAELAKIPLAETKKITKQWAEKILERQRQGDKTLAFISTKYARQALGIEP